MFFKAKGWALMKEHSLPFHEIFHLFCFPPFCILLSYIPLPFTFIHKDSYSACFSLFSCFFTSFLQVYLLNQILLFPHSKQMYRKETERRQQGGYNHIIFFLHVRYWRKCIRNIIRVNNILDCLMFYFSSILQLFLFWWSSGKLVIENYFCIVSENTSFFMLLFSQWIFMQGKEISQRKIIIYVLGL